MSAHVTNPHWATNTTIDLMTAADQDEMTALRITESAPLLAEDRDLAEFLSTRAANLRAEISRRLESAR